MVGSHLPLSLELAGNANVIGAGFVVKLSVHLGLHNVVSPNPVLIFTTLTNAVELYTEVHIRKLIGVAVVEVAFLNVLSHEFNWDVLVLPLKRMKFFIVVVPSILVDHLLVGVFVAVVEVNAADYEVCEVEDHDQTESNPPKDEVKTYVVGSSLRAEYRN